ncbi:MAG: UDP-3-O-(3-hydroxymyristoyl)glucosamine N-acyltransferase [Fluviicola sp. XM-24bin1]|nr:MAG: UDP-3-O-(3-hydroxymyristoyl)glucosamine N-acyltransferase [Fluviicola sp. XM-24bin1]
MKLKKEHTVAEIAALIDATFVGDANHLVTGLNEIHRVEPGDLMFVDHPKYYQKALKSAATTILIDQEVECPDGKALIISEQPFDDYNKLTRHFAPTIPWTSNVGENCTIDPTATIYPNVTIGHDVTIGKNVILYPGAVIGDRSVLEDSVIVGSNSVIGHYAFYYKKKETGFDRMHSCGDVRLEKNVEIGALCTIDAGVSATTIVGEGTKIDNQVHIGHDTVVGKHCLMAANVGIAGCVTIEDRVTLWGQVGVVSDIVIGEGAVVLGQAGVGRSLEGGKSYLGSPCDEARTKFREIAAVRKLPEIIEKL